MIGIITNGNPFSNVYLRTVFWAEYLLYITSVNIFGVFWPHPATCGILVPSSGIKSMPPALEAWSLNHWITRDFPAAVLFLRIVLSPCKDERTEILNSEFPMLTSEWQSPGHSPRPLWVHVLCPFFGDRLPL